MAIFIPLIKNTEYRNNNMKVFVNDEEILIHNGARVMHVVHAYYMQCNKKPPSQWPNVTDAYGNSVALDGELSQGNHFYITTKET